MKNLAVAFCLSFLALTTSAQGSSQDDILRRAEVMPVYKECTDERFAEAPYPCTMKQLTDYFMKEVVFDNPTSVTKCVLTLVVEKDGSVSDIKMARGVVVASSDPQEKEQMEDKINTAIIDKAKELKFMSPAYQNGEKVRVRMQFSASVRY